LELNLDLHLDLVNYPKLSKLVNMGKVPEGLALPSARKLWVWIRAKALPFGIESTGSSAGSFTDSR